MTSKIQIMISQIESIPTLIICIIIIVIIYGYALSNKNKNLRSEQFLRSEQLTNEIYSDRELQEQILKTLKYNQQDNRVIKNWVVFWSWLLIIGFILITLFRLNYY